MDLQAKMGNVILRPYQAEIVHNTITYIREQWQQKKPFEPAFINAFVASGKTLVMGGIAHYASSKNANVMILARQGELAEQNSEECFNMGVANSVYSASLGKKQVMHNVIVGTEKTVANALDTDFANWVPHILVIDECFTSDTLIETKNGWFRIDDKQLADQEIACMCESTGRIFYHKPVRVFKNGIRSISHVKLLDGELKCTSTHKIWSEGSWVQARELKTGQKVRRLDLQSCVLKKLLRASVAVAKKLFQARTWREAGDR